MPETLTPPSAAPHSPQPSREPAVQATVQSPTVQPPTVRTTPVPVRSPIERREAAIAAILGNATLDPAAYLADVFAPYGAE